MPADTEINDELIAERRQGAVGSTPADMAPLAALLVSRIDRSMLLIGRLVSYMVIPLFVVMVYEILVRKLFTAPTLWAYDISRMLYGAFFMLGSAYALMRGVHIRADFIYRNWTARVQGGIDTLLYVVLYFPGLIFFLYISTEFAWEAWQRGERASDTAWMPYVGPVRTSLPFGILLLIIQGVSEIIKSWYAFTRNRWP